MKKSKIDLAAEDVADRDVDGQPHIEAILDALKNMNAEHTTVVKEVLNAERAIAEFRALAEPYEQKLVELARVQNEVAIGCCLGNTEALQQWADAEAAIQDAQRFRRQHELALPAYENWAKRSPSRVASMASKVEQLEMDLYEARMAAKLQVASDRFAQ